MRRFNPIPYSPILTKYDQDGDGDFDLEDIKILRQKRKEKQETANLCGAITKSGEKCGRRGNPEYNNRCHHHKNYQKSN